MRLLIFHLLTCSCAFGVSLYSESAFGSMDLPDVYTDSLLLVAGEGSNTLEAQTILDQPNFFTLRIEEGLQLEQINVVFYDHLVSGNATFLGFQRGTIFDRDPGEFTASNLTHVLFSRGDENRDILSQVISPLPGTIAPLGPGDYAFWINEVEPEVATFTLDFVTVAIPEPNTYALFLVVFVATLGIRKRKSS